MEGPPHLQDWVEMRATAIDGVRVLRAHFVEHKFDRHSHEGWSIGVTFDGNLESLPEVFLYTDEQARAVHVATQGITEALTVVYKTKALLQELGIGNPAL